MKQTIVGFLSSLLCCTVAFGDVVQTQSGPVLGVDARDSSVEVFKGIPYAASPLGDLRWRPPQPSAPWTGTRVCDSFGPKAMQRKGFEKGKQSEGTMFVPRNVFGTVTNYKAVMTERFGQHGDKVAAFYDPKSEDDLRQVTVQQITDSWFVRPAREFARAMDEQGTPVWMYHFTKPVWGWMGAAHAAEIGYVFGNLEEPSSEDAGLSDALMDYWVRFATTGDPNVSRQPNWPKFDQNDHTCINVSAVSRWNLQHALNTVSLK